MKLFFPQLTAHLKTSLLPIYLISGNEHLLVQETRQMLLQAASQQGFLEVKRFEMGKEFDWQKFYESYQTHSLFCDKIVIELRLNNNPNAANAKLLTEYMITVDENCLLLLVCNKLDSSAQKSAWFNTANSRGATITLWPLEGQQFKQWVITRLQQKKIQLDALALDFLISQTEGNLLALEQETEKLTLLFSNKKITLEMITQAIADNARYDIFQFIDAIFGGKSDRIQKMLLRLRQEGVEPTLIIWILAKEIRLLVKIMTALKANTSWQIITKNFKIWEKRQPLIKKMLQLHSIKGLHQLLLHIEKIDHIIKGVRQANCWNEMEIVALSLAGGSLPFRAS